MVVDAAADVDGTSDDNGGVAGDGSKGVGVGGTAGVDLVDVDAELEDGVIGCKRCRLV